MEDRKQQILDLAAELLQSRSFTSFSYHDLSEALGISKASIHHHFPTKEELLLALAERYRVRQRLKLAEIDALHERADERLRAFLEVMSCIVQSGTKICAVGALQAEFNVIPERVRDAVREMYDTPKAWLTCVLDQGRSESAFEFEGDAARRAALILAAVQGALQIARARGAEEFAAVVRELEAGLTPRTLSRSGRAVRQPVGEWDRIEVK
jgi:TetR/AcrR family transcriptional repressor of nem operon